MSAKDEQTSASASELAAVSQSNNLLAINLYKQLILKEKKNVFFSPFSISTAMAMLFCGAKSHTAQEMRAVLGYEEASIQDHEIKSSFRALLEELEKNPDNYILACANSMVSHKDFSVRRDFINILKESFNALLRQVDFANESREAVSQINDWVKEKTNGMIPQLLDGLDQSTVIVLLNAVYFRGLWVQPFEKSSTYKQKFYNGGKQDNAKDIDMMHITKSFPCIEKDTLKAIKLPYIGNDIAMFILLPNSVGGLPKVEGLISPTFIEGLHQQMRKLKVEVALPKFKLEYCTPLKEEFKALGLVTAFNSSADFSVISDKEGICVSEIIHKAVVDVTEDGTEAAAATAVMMVNYCMVIEPDPIEFVVDHPFAFAIYNTKSNMILFLGRVNEL